MFCECSAGQQELERLHAKIGTMENDFLSKAQGPIASVAIAERAPNPIQSVGKKASLSHSMSQLPAYYRPNPVGEDLALMRLSDEIRSNSPDGSRRIGDELKDRGSVTDSA